MHTAHSFSSPLSFGAPMRGCVAAPPPPPPVLRTDERALIVIAATVQQFHPSSNRVELFNDALYSSGASLVNLFSVYVCARKSPSAGLQLAKSTFTYVRSHH